MFELHLKRSVDAAASHIQVTLVLTGAFNWLKLIGAPIDLKTGEETD